MQRGHSYCIVDEVDSILIDEARTPLIISGAPETAAGTYRDFARIVPRLKPGEDYEVDEKQRTVSVTESGVAKVEKALNIDNLYKTSTAPWSTSSCRRCAPRRSTTTTTSTSSKTARC